MSESPPIQAQGAVKTIEEPVRWLDDPTASAALRADLVHGASASAGGVDYAAALTGLRTAIAAQTGALAPAAVAGKSLGFKVLVGTVAIGAVAALWMGRDTSTPRADVARAPSAAVDRTAIEPAPKQDPAPVVAPSEPPPVSAPVPAQPSVVADPIPEEPEAIEPDLPREKVRKPRAIDESDDDRFLREAQLVAQARKQLGSNAKQALASTRKHEREFPEGALVEERRALEVRALAKLGRMDEARREAESFLGEFGDGPHAASVRRAVAGE